MNIGNVGGMRNDWFTYSKHTLPDGKELPVASLKPECQEQLNAYCDSVLQQEQAQNTPYKKPELTEDQLNELNSKYDGTNMSPEQYQLFLHDLVAMGVFSEQDRLKTGGMLQGGLRPVVPTTTVSVAPTQNAVASEQTQSFLSYSFSHDAQKVNITDWVKYRSSFDTYHIGKSGTRYESNEGKLFQSIADVLAQMAKAKA